MPHLPRPARARRRGISPTVSTLLLLALTLLAACGKDKEVIPVDDGPTKPDVPTGPTDPDPVTIASVTITRGDSLILIVGTVDSVQAEVKDSEGKVVDNTVVWASSSPNVVAVDSAGGLTPFGIGNATVTASTDGVTGSIAVSVEEYRVATDVVIADEQTVSITSDTTALVATGEIRIQTSEGAAPIVEGTVINAIMQDAPILRMVESTTQNGNEVVAQTRPATIADAVEAGTIGYVQALGSNATSPAPMRALAEAARAGTVIESCVGDAQAALQQNVAQMVSANSPFASAVRNSYSPVAIPLQANTATDVQVNADGSFSPAGSQGVWFFDIAIPNNKGVDINFRMEVSNARAAFTPVVCFMGQLNKDVSTVEEVAELAAESVGRLLTKGKLPKVRVSQLRFQVNADVSFDADVKTSITASKAFSAGDIDFGKLGGKLAKAKSLACPWFPTVTVPVGPIVLAFQPSFCLNLVAEVYAAVQASVEQSVHLDSNVMLGAWYAKWGGKGTKRYFKPISGHASNLSATEPMVDLSGQVGARLGLKPEVGLYLYGVAGPYFNVEAGVDASAQASLQSGWSVGLNGYVNAGAGLKLKIPIIEETLVDQGFVYPLWTSETSLWSGAFTSPLSLTVSPTAEQTRDWDGSVTYTMSVTSNGMGVSGVKVPITNGLTGGQGTVTTGANGLATFKTTVANGKANGSYEVAFGPVTRAGYEPSGTEKRSIKVEHLEALRIGTCVSTVEEPNGCYEGVLQPGTAYNVFMGADIPTGGQAVCGATIPIVDAFTGQTTTVNMPVAGSDFCLSHYPFTVPADAQPGEYTFVLGPATAPGWLESTKVELVVTVAGTPGSVSGKVTVNGDGVAAVDVTLVRVADNNTSAAKTSDDGSYAFTNLKAGDYTVQVSAPLYTFPQPTQNVTLANGQDATIDFEGSSAGGGGSTATISGSVTVGDVGLGGVTVNLAGPTGSASTTTAADGTFGFGSLTTGSYYVSISYDTGLYAFAQNGFSVAATIGEVATANFSGTSLGANVVSVAVTPGAATLAPGETVQLTATPRSADGTEVTGRPVQWTSSNTNVVSVDATGLARGAGGGTASVTATVDGRSASALVTVTAVSSPFLGLSMSRVDFAAEVGAASPAAQIVNITNGGSGALTSIAVDVDYGSGQAGWLESTLLGTNAPTILTLDPSSTALAVGTYEATVTVSASGASNGPVTLPVTLTVSEPDIPVGEVPAVVSWSVEEGATGVHVESPVSVTFSVDMDPATLTPSTLTLSGPDGGVTATVTYEAGSRTATLTPDSELTEMMSEYTATVSTGVRSATGAPLPQAVTRTFTTVLVDEHYWYYIKNRVLGDQRFLDTYSNTYQCFMGEGGNFTGQFWNFVPQEDGRYALRNSFGGDEQFLEGANGVDPCLLTGTPQGGGYFSGQLWRIEKLGDWFQLVLNNGFALAADETHPPRIETKSDSQSQQWRVQRIGKR